MRVVIFAHTPPPLHGQSYMVRLLLDGLENSANPHPIECFHVNARFSDELGTIGAFSFTKILRLFVYCAQALWYRFRYGAKTLYYIPAPPKRIALYRDFLGLLLCRPVFRHLVFHWEAGGLAAWVRDDASSLERSVAHWLLGSPDLSITLADALSDDAAYFASKRISVIPNGIPDPCPDFDAVVLPVRSALLRRRRETSSGSGETFRVVFLAHCTREKGLFDTLEAIALANARLTEHQSPVRLHLTIAGTFLDADERREFDSWHEKRPAMIDYAGFLNEEAKRKLLRESDCLCFPTYYSAEAQPVSIVEAMAFGLTIVATAWRGIPDLLPDDYPYLIQKHDPATIANALVASMKANVAAGLRARYCELFTSNRYVASLAEAFHSVATKS